MENTSQDTPKNKGVRPVEKYHKATELLLSSFDSKHWTGLPPNRTYTQVFREYWSGHEEPTEIKPLALNPGIVGSQTQELVSNPVLPGHLSGPPDNNSLWLRDTRSYLFKKEGHGYYLLKGVGRKFLSDSSENVKKQFGFRYIADKNKARSHGWGSVGGLLVDSAESELRNGLRFAENFREIFGRYPKIRLPREIYGIDPQMEEKPEVDNLHTQIVYEIDTPVRSSFGYYLADLGSLWTGFDLKTDNGRDKALESLNELLSAYPSRYTDKQVDLLKIGDLQRIFELIAERELLVSGEDDDMPLDKEESIDNERGIGILRYSILKEGYSLAEKFYQNNQELVNMTLEKEVEALAENIGFATAMGYELGQSVSPKDTYGGTMADLDTVSTFTVHKRFSDLTEEDSEFPDEAIKFGLHTVITCSSMLGLKYEQQLHFIRRYFEKVAGAFSITTEDSNVLGPDIVPELTDHFSAIKEFAAKRGDYLETKYTEDFNYLSLILSLCSETIKTKLGVEFSDSFSFETWWPRRSLGLLSPLVLPGRGLVEDKFLELIDRPDEVKTATLRAEKGRFIIESPSLTN